MKILALLLCLLPMWAFGQTAKKRPVKFTCVCTDSVGARVATAVRDLIALSPRYKDATDFQTGSGDKMVYNLGIRVVSIDPASDSSGHSTMFSYTITVGPIYLVSGVENCGSARVNECAADIIAALDGQASQ